MFQIENKTALHANCYLSGPRSDEFRISFSGINTSKLVIDWIKCRLDDYYVMHIKCNEWICYYVYESYKDWYAGRNMFAVIHMYMSGG